jgi:signal transduction histidine kinase
MTWTRRALRRRERAGIAAAALALILVIGAGDHFSANVLSFALLYALPIAAAAWFVSTGAGFGLSLLSVAIWAAGDFAAGVTWDNMLVPGWNAGVRLVCYAALVAVVAGLHRLQLSLEERVIERTAALRKQIDERQRLEKELLRISERERTRLGQDLHDSLCQHLTGTAMAGKVLANKLARQQLPEAQSAENVVRLIETAILQSRHLARGLSPLALHDGNLTEALREFAASTSELFGVSCRLESPAPAPSPDADTASQLYRIAQEAVSNAVKHGRADRIVITLTRAASGTLLKVEDNGVGLPQHPPRNGGMGLRIMSHRANRVGASFEVVRGDVGGTEVRCVLPPENERLEAVNG